MTKLIVQRNQLEYWGIFSIPAFSLWTDVAGIIQGLYNIFSPFDISLSDFNNEANNHQLSELAITVNFGSNGRFKIKVDRIELFVVDYTREDFAILPQLLSTIEQWLKDKISGFSFKSHAYSTVSHGLLAEGSAKDFLRGVNSIDVEGVGVNEGHGVIFHWKLPEDEWRVQLAIDLSSLIEKGLFISFLVRPKQEQIDFAVSTQKGNDLFNRVLHQIGLEIE